MKLLCIGKPGNVYKLTVFDEFSKSFEIVECANGTSDDDIIAAAHDADFMAVDAMAPVSEKLINAMPNLKMIHSEGVGYNGVNLEAAKAKGVIVANCRAVNAHAVAEQAVLLMLASLKSLIRYDEGVRNGSQITIKEGHMVRADLPEMSEMKVGLFGFGAIAKEVAAMLRPFGAQVVYYDAFRPSKEVEEQFGVEFEDIDTLVSTCDIISIHVPHTPETRNMFNDEMFAKMKKGAYLVNTARGEIVDSEALLRAIENGQIAGAGLDTVAGEPIQADNVIFSKPEAAKKIIFSPHIGGITGKTMRKSYVMIWDDIKKVCEGKEPFSRIV